MLKKVEWTKAPGREYNQRYSCRLLLVFTRILDPKVISVVVLHGAAAKKEVVCRRRSELRPSLDEYKVAAI